jgi:hypothetical protein
VSVLSEVVGSVTVIPEREAVTESTSTFTEIVGDEFTQPDYASAAAVNALGPQLQDMVGVGPLALSRWLHRSEAAPGIYRVLEQDDMYCLTFSPGTVALKATVNKAHEQHDTYSDRQWKHEPAFKDDEDVTIKRGAILMWSPRSRARMVRRIAELDLSDWHQDGGQLGLVTLTLPGNWSELAPTGSHFKDFVRAFAKRWRRQVSIPWRGIWKLEFQLRGAPHMHILMRVPATVRGEVFESWLARTWADVVGASGEDRRKHELHGTDVSWSGVKFSDPRRTSIYFLKHSSKSSGGKEYQHIVPEEWAGEDAGPGRFWGVWGLKAATADVYLTREQFMRARRILRGVSRGRAARAEFARLRFAGRNVDLFTMRRLRAPGFSGVNGGWVLVNDGMLTAYDLARALALIDT